MTMRGATVFIKGIAVGNLRATLYSWFFNFLFSLFIYWGIYKLFTGAAGDSVIAAKNLGELSMFTFLADIGRNHGVAMGLVIALGLAAALLYFSVSIFLAGGIYSAMVGDERPTFTNLLASSIENFFNMIILFLINLLNLVLALLVPVLLLIFFVSAKSLFTNETALEIFRWGWGLLTLILLTVSIAIYDFARIFKLKEDCGAFRAFKRGLKFTFTNKFNTLVIFLLYALTLMLLYLVYSIVLNLTENLLYALLLLALYQGFMMLRFYLKITVMQAEVFLTEGF